MQFSFYPGHERGCGHPNDCPHLGGAAVGTLVHIVNTSEDSRLYIHRQFDGERKRNSELVAEVVRLEKKVEQLQLGRRLERQNKFATNKQKSETCENETHTEPEKKLSGKRGAPAGHTGWYRKTPTQYDIRIDVPAPRRCPHCKKNNVLHARLVRDGRMGAINATICGSRRIAGSHLITE